jgi:ferredoxin-NADP reductase
MEFPSVLTTKSFLAVNARAIARTIRRPEGSDGVASLQLAGVEAVTHNVKTFQFKPVGGELVPFEYLAGQFLTLHIEPCGIPTSRSHAIASTPTLRDRIEITVKREHHGLVSR